MLDDLGLELIGDDFVAGVGQVSVDQVEAHLVRVHDGDTFVADVEGWPSIVGREVAIRLLGIDAAEINDIRPLQLRMAHLAKDRLTDLLTKTKIMLTSIRRDKYFRLLATVATDKVTDIADLLLAEGLVRPYFGKGPKPW